MPPRFTTVGKPTVARPAFRPTFANQRSLYWLVTVIEVPCEFVSVTATLATGNVAAPDVVKGTVSENWLPIGGDADIEAALAYQAAKTLANGTVTSAGVIVLPVVGVKWNCPLTMSFGVENPLSTTLKPPLTVTILTEAGLMNGGVEVTARVIGAPGGIALFAESVAVSVIVTVPATVPVITAMLAAPPIVPLVAPAGTETFAVRVPFAKRTSRLSPPPVATNVSVKVPVTFSG